MKRKKIFNKKTSASTINSFKNISAKTNKKPLTPLAKPLSVSKPKLKLTSKNKRKNISPKKVVRKDPSSDSASTSSSSESECEHPVKRKSRIVSKKLTSKKITESSSDDSDILSDESYGKEGRIIRIPVDREEQHKYYK